MIRIRYQRWGLSLSGFVGAMVVRAFLGAGPALAEDAQPRDFLPAPPGTNLGLLYYLYGSSNTYISSSGSKVPGSGLETNIGIARYVRFFDVGGKLVDFNIVQPFGRLSNMSIGGNHLATDGVNIGDTTLVSTIWLLNDPARNRYFAVANYLTLPTGHYDSNKAGLGSNRWSGAVQPAFYFDIAPKFSVDLVGDVTIYGANSDGPGGLTSRKAPNYTGIFWANYNPNEVTTLSLGAETTFGGEETWGGVGHGNIQVTTLRAACLEMLTPTTQLAVQLGTDVDAKNTFKNQISALVRLAKFF